MPILANVNPTVNTPMPGREIQAGKRLVGKIWPTGRFGMAWRDGGGLERGDARVETEQRLFTGTQHPIGLSNASNYHRNNQKSRKPRGMNGLTARGKRIVESAAFLLEEKYGRKNLTFATVTLPYVTFDESWWVSSNWGQIVRVFFQGMTRLMKRKGLPGHYVAVTEMQPKRSDRERHPALHLHWVFVGRARSGGWGVTPAEVREVWKRVVSQYIDGDRDWGACENLQMVRKTTEGYLAKYLSKGVTGEAWHSEPMAGYELPKSWYSISRGLLRSIASQVITSEKVLSQVYEAMHRHDYANRFEFLGEVAIRWAEREVPVAIYGMIERSEWRDWREIRQRLKGLPRIDLEREL